MFCVISGDGQFVVRPQDPLHADDKNKGEMLT